MKTENLDNFSIKAPCDTRNTGSKNVLNRHTSVMLWFPFRNEKNNIKKTHKDETQAAATIVFMDTSRLFVTKIKYIPAGNSFRRLNKPKMTFINTSHKRQGLA